MLELHLLAFLHVDTNFLQLNCLKGLYNGVNMKRRAKGKTLVLAGLGLVGFVAAGIAISKKLKSPITSITWSSKEVEKLDLAWYDEEKGAMYKIYWSNRKGIKIDNRNTYLNVIQVTTLSQIGDSMHHKATISMKEEWVYIVIAKKGYTSAEFEARITQAKSFNLANLGLEIIKNGEDGKDVHLKVAVLNGMEAYRVSLYLPDGNCWNYDFNITNTRTECLRFPSQEDCIVYLSAKISERWSDPEFVCLLRPFILPIDN
jgi:hypothetical protein